MTEEAIKKIMSGIESAKKVGREAAVMAKPVADKMAAFCRQDEEFARAVVQGGSFVECMKSVAKSCGHALSDLDAYTKAVRFYFPGAKIRVSMNIDLVGDAAMPELLGRGVLLDLTSFL